MIINCPKCKSELDLPDEAAGYRVEQVHLAGGADFLKTEEHDACLAVTQTDGKARIRVLDGAEVLVRPPVL